MILIKYIGASAAHYVSMLAVRETDRTRGAYALWRLADVLLPLFGAALIAIALRGLGGLLSRLCRFAEAVPLGVVILMVTPVLALLSTVAFSVLAGPSAVLLAAPLTLSLLVVPEVIYVQHALGERAPLQGGCP